MKTFYAEKFHFYNCSVHGQVTPTYWQGELPRPSLKMPQEVFSGEITEKVPNADSAWQQNQICFISLCIRLSIGTGGNQGN